MVFIVDGNCHANRVHNFRYTPYSAAFCVWILCAQRNRYQSYDAQISHLTVSAAPSTMLKQVAAYATIAVMQHVLKTHQRVC